MLYEAVFQFEAADDQGALSVVTLMEKVLQDRGFQQTAERVTQIVVTHMPLSQESRCT